MASEGWEAWQPKGGSLQSQQADVGYSHQQVPAHDQQHHYAQCNTRYSLYAQPAPHAIDSTTSSHELAFPWGMELSQQPAQCTVFGPGFWAHRLNFL